MTFKPEGIIKKAEKKGTEEITALSSDGWS